MYHLGRPGHELVYLQRVLHAWGIDGHNSHTNVCSSSARAGYAFWHGMDRPSPDHANARFILLLSSHLEAGHYFNPHAQRLIEAKERGAKVCVIDSRLSNTASMADWWLAPWPGPAAALLLAMASVLRRDRAQRLAQGRARAAAHAATRPGVERAPDAARVPPRVLRDELPPAALPEGGARQARDVLHPRLQPGVDQSRWHVVDRDVDR